MASSIRAQTLRQFVPGSISPSSDAAPLPAEPYGAPIPAADFKGGIVPPAAQDAARISALGGLLGAGGVAASTWGALDNKLFGGALSAKAKPILSAHPLSRLGRGIRSAFGSNNAHFDPARYSAFRSALTAAPGTRTADQTKMISSTFSRLARTF